MLAFLMGLPTLAGATDYVERQFGEFHGWRVYWSAPLKGCYVEKRLPDGGHIRFGKRLETGSFAIDFQAASVYFPKTGESYEMVLDFDRHRQGVSMSGSDSGSHRRLYGVYPQAEPLIRRLKQSDTVSISYQKKRLALIFLRGSTAAFDAVDTCLVEMKVPPSIAVDIARLESEVAKRESEFGAGHPRVAELLTQLGRLQLERGNAAAAGANLRKAVAIQEQAFGPDSPEAAISLNELATVLSFTGQAKEAEALYRRAMAGLETARGLEDEDVGGILHNIAMIRMANEDLATAEQLFHRALQIREKTLGPSHVDVAATLSHLAELAKRKDQADEAEALARRAVQIVETAAGKGDIALLLPLSTLSSILAFKGDFAAAEEIVRRQLDVRDKATGAESPDHAQDLITLAALLAEQGQLADAERMYGQGMRTLENAFGPDSPHVGVAVAKFGEFYASNGAPHIGEPLLQRASAILASQKGIVSAQWQGGVLTRLALIEADKGNLPTALEHLRQAARDDYISRGAYLHLLDRSGLSHPENVVESFSVIQQVSSSAAGTALQQFTARASAGDERLSAMVREAQDLAAEKASLDRAILAQLAREDVDGATLSAIRGRSEEIAARIDLLQNTIVSEYPRFAELTKSAVIELEESQRLLTEDEALIVIDVPAERYEPDDFVWAVTREGVRWTRLETKRGEISSDIGELRAGLDLNQPDRQPIDPSAAHSLYEKLLGQVKDVISDKKHLIFVLNGAVSALPPQVLVTEKPATRSLREAAWLVRDHSITVMPTVSGLRMLRAQSASARAPEPFIAYADPVFNSEDEGQMVPTAPRGFASFYRGNTTDLASLRSALIRLPATADEVRSVAESLQAPQSALILREAATETSVKQTQLDRFDILYFATHGLVAGEVADVAKSGAEPALAFSLPEKASELDDGLLTASEVSGLKLNANWVVLSACNTAAAGHVGAEALSGLARAFFYAGARSLLVSHWVVDDSATAALMSRLFTTAAAPGQRASEALRLAMLSLIDDPGSSVWNDPAYWAPFVLVGEPHNSSL